MTVKFVNKERNFIKHLKILTKSLFEINQSYKSQDYEQSKAFLVLQIEILWIFRKIVNKELKNKLNMFFSLDIDKVSELKYCSLLKDIKITDIGKYLVFDYSIIFKEDFNKYFRSILNFIKDYEIKQKFYLDGYLVGLTYEYFMQNKQRSKTGSFYTPEILAKTLSEKTINSYISLKINSVLNLSERIDFSSPNEVNEIFKNNDQNSMLKILKSITIFDPTMGVGNFLVEGFEYLLSLYEYLNIDENSNTPLTISNQIFGLDIDKISTKITKIRLLFTVLNRKSTEKEFDSKSFFSNIITLDALENLPPISTQIPFDQKPPIKSFSIILSNPPHGAKLDSNIKIQAKRFFKTVSGIEKNETPNSKRKLTKGNPNSAVLFSEICGTLLSNNGFCGIILPKSLLYIEAWESIRSYLTTEVDLLSIVDLQKGFDSVLLEQIICIFKGKNLSNTKSSTEGKYAIEEFNNENKLILKSRIDRPFLTYEKYLITINDENKRIFKQVRKSPLLKDLGFKSHRGLVVSRYLEKEKTKTNEQILKGKDIQPLYIRDLSYCPSTEIEPKTYFTYGTLMIQRIVAHVQKPRPHIILTVALNPGLPTVDTIVNIYSNNKSSIEFKVLAMYLHSELINWYTYHFIYCEAIRSMDVFGYYLNQVPLKSFYSNQKTLSQIFELLTLLKTIKLKEVTYIEFIDKAIKFFEQLGNAIIYYVYFRDETDEIQKNYLFTFQKFDLPIIDIDEFNFDHWYQHEQFLEIKRWSLDKNLLNAKLKALIENIKLKEWIHSVEQHPWVNMIMREFRNSD